MLYSIIHKFNKGADLMKKVHKSIVAFEKMGKKEYCPLI